MNKQQKVKIGTYINKNIYNKMKNECLLKQISISDYIRMLIIESIKEEKELYDSIDRKIVDDYSLTSVFSKNNETK